jgi:hypothetical protein
MKALLDHNDSLALLAFVGNNIRALRGTGCTMPTIEVFGINVASRFERFLCSNQIEVRQLALVLNER